jgi:NAD(P)-dependent dehydrogenase (short-subunit alcohol dehydrogenase family)
MRRQRWGRIVNLGSVGGTLTFPGGAFYHATKYAVEALSDVMRFELRDFGIHVIIIEPGAIKTAFGETAIAAVGRVKQENSAYTTFNAAVAGKIHEAMDGPLSAIAGTPDDVAKAIERAVTAEKPHTRYTITAAARVMMFLKRWLPDRGFDAFLGTQYPRPS